MALPRPCLDCGAITNRTRCPECTRQHERTRRPSTAARGYGSQWQAYSKGQINEEPWCHATPCGWPDTAGTPANPLTTDHVDRGLVLCRNDNARKQHADARGGG